MTTSGEKEEGYFFTWSMAELEAVLNKDDLALAKRFFTLDGFPHFEGRYIPHITEASEKIAEAFGLDKEALENRIEGIKQILYKDRQRKAPPFTDTKILAAWNGMMISAFVDQSSLIGEIQRIVPFLAGRVAINQETTA